MSDEKNKQTTADKSLTRIALRHVYFRESLDIPGQGHGPIADCGDPGNGRPHLLAEFVPALQCVRFEFKTPVVKDRETFLVPCAAIVRMVQE